MKRQEMIEKVKDFIRRLPRDSRVACGTTVHVLEEATGDLLAANPHRVETDGRYQRDALHTECTWGLVWRKSPQHSNLIWLDRVDIWEDCDLAVLVAKLMEERHMPSELREEMERFRNEI